MKQFLKFMFASMLGFILSCLLLMFIFFLVIAAVVSTGDKAVKIPAKSVLVVKLDEPVPERSTDNPFRSVPLEGFQYMTSLGLNDILQNIGKASADPNISGILLDLGETGLQFGSLEEVRNALTSFKKSGKFIVSFADYYSQPSYYLATVSDKIFLHPEGMFDWKGLDARLLFFKGMLEKLDMEMQVIRHGKYKSAVEPLISDQMSPENREQTLAFIRTFWDHMVTGIAEARKLSPATLNDLADRLAVGNPSEALRAGMVDSLVYRDGLIAWLYKKTGQKEEEKLSYVNLRKYNDVPDPVKKEVSRDKIAVIYAVGDIVEGEGSEDNAGAEKIARSLRKARKDKNIKAVVLRINSPGGVMVSSDVIWREVGLTKKEKPVVASFGSYAASGGYYIACGASRIVADPTTITGSIGVFSVIPNLEGTLKNKLGITSDGVMTHRHSDYIPVLKPLNDYQEALLNKEVERAYGVFVDRVAQGRRLTPARVDSIGQGRVWSGISALQLGLVDELGDLGKAVETAASLAKVEKYRLVELPALKDPFSAILEYLSGDYQEDAAIRSGLGDYYPLYEQLQSLRDLKGVQARLPFSVQIR